MTRRQVLKQEIIIGVSLLIAIALILGVKVWLHNFLKFKMDESSILKFFEESSNDFSSCSSEVISAGTNIVVSRVSDVCTKSKVIKRNSKKNESWYLK